MNPSIHPALLPEEALLAECEARRQRRSGPGGQHRNKVETAVVLVHLPSGERGEASERRSQALNRSMAIQRLRVKLALAIRTPNELVPEAASELWQSRSKSGSLVANVDHPDFPALLAEALDVLSVCGFDLPRVSQRLGCTGSQLLKLLKQEPAALVLVNKERRQRNLRPLR